jgi:hypothetical protein
LITGGIWRRSPPNNINFPRISIRHDPFH